MLLTTTSDLIQIVTGTAVPVDVAVEYTDLNAGVVSAGRLLTKITTAATTTVVASPAASTARKVQEMQVQNIHASSSVLVTIQQYDGSSTVNLEQVTLLAGERIGYRPHTGYTLVDANGAQKNTASIIAGQVQVARLGADLANATTTAAKVTGLDTQCGVGTWAFEYWVLYTSSVVTTGIKLGVNHSGTVTSFVYNMYGTTADITTNTSLMDQDVLLTTGSTMSAWAARAKTTTAPMISSGVDTISVDTLMRIDGLAVVTVTGNLELYHASETANSTTVKAGTGLRLTKIG